MDVFYLTTKTGILEREGFKITKDYYCHKENGVWAITDYQSGLLIKNNIDTKANCIAWVRNKDNLKSLDAYRNKDSYKRYCEALIQFKKDNHLNQKAEDKD
jgi:hypothetical protein